MSAHPVVSGPRTTWVGVSGREEETKVSGNERLWTRLDGWRPSMAAPRCAIRFDTMILLSLLLTSI
ncbi:MAG: hypothetical protein GDA56_01550 [Hormoscilla sp. GM7CHS1pb]|nr:hypothetical protein [Hormoscilla sp. GM7CHS1pb]